MELTTSGHGVFGRSRSAAHSRAVDLLMGPTPSEKAPSSLVLGNQPVEDLFVSSGATVGLQQSDRLNGLLDGLMDNFDLSEGQRESYRPHSHGDTAGIRVQTREMIADMEARSRGEIAPSDLKAVTKNMGVLTAETRERIADMEARSRGQIAPSELEAISKNIAAIGAETRDKLSSMKSRREAQANGQGEKYSAELHDKINELLSGGDLAESKGRAASKSREGSGKAKAAEASKTPADKGEEKAGASSKGKSEESKGGGGK